MGMGCFVSSCKCNSCLDVDGCNKDPPRQLQSISLKYKRSPQCEPKLQQPKYKIIVHSEEEDNNNYNSEICCFADFRIPWYWNMDETGGKNTKQQITKCGRDVVIGSMMITKPQYKALLIFPKEDRYCHLVVSALCKMSFQYEVVSSVEDAKESFNRLQHHLLVVDSRQGHVSDAEALCRWLRGSYVGSFTTIVAIVTRRNQVDENSSVRELIQTGFDRVISETSLLDEVEDELLQLEAGPLTNQMKFRSCQALFTALERSRDAIQIADEKHQIQYVNKMFEKETGFSSSEVIGSCLSRYVTNEKNEDDIWERIKAELEFGREWKGNLYTNVHTGGEVQLHVLFLPLSNHDGAIHQYVVVSRPLLNTNPCSNLPDMTQFIGGRRKNSFEFHRRHSGTNDQLQYRRMSASSAHDGSDSNTHKRANSLAKIHSMAIEAPITQIINLINLVKDNSQPGVGEVLDQILDILRNSELYSPADLPSKSRDPMLSDFVEGLVTGSGFSHRRSSGGDNMIGKINSFRTQHHHHHHQVTTGTGVLVSGEEHSCYLRDFDSWDYDILALERVTLKKPLVHLGMHALNQFNVCDVLQCSQNTLHAWLSAIEANYHSSNPYHNSTHAADVLHATAYFLNKERLKSWMEPVDEAAILIAAIIHDVDHPGRTNAFLINSNNPLALLYNDTAVLESHHAAFAFKFTVNTERCNIFKNMTRDNFMNIRASIIDMVLATELSKHFEHVNKFISIVTKCSSNNQVFDKEAQVTTQRSSSGGASAAVTHELRTLIKRVMIKVADVINPARKRILCVEWARRISEEYFAQTDEEKRAGYPVVMPHFDRNTCSLPKSQITFIDYFLTDMCEAWHEFCGVEEVMSNLNDNYSYWKRLQDRGIMRLAQLEDEANNDLLDPESAFGEAPPSPTATDDTATTACDGGDKTLVENHLL